LLLTEPFSEVWHDWENSFQVTMQSVQEKTLGYGCGLTF
jgi:hypothetical protein